MTDTEARLKTLTILYHSDTADMVNRVHEAHDRSVKAEAEYLRAVAELVEATSFRRAAALLGMSLGAVQRIVGRVA